MLDEPLGLTVHSLPSPQGAVQRDSQRTRAGRFKMLLVLAICAAPVVASYFTYYVVRPEGRRNYGELIEPQRALPAANGTTLDGRTVALPSMQGQWLLVSVSGGACDALCEKHLYLQRQLREGLGKEKDRVDWVWLIDDKAPVRPEVAAAVAQATVLRVDANELSRWLAPASGHALSQHLYVVDPMGHWMMRFPPVGQQGIDTASAKKIKSDMERLLRASASWDQPGRNGR